MMPESKSVAVGDTLEITPTVAEQSGYDQTFQWYKDGQELDGQINKTLTIENVTADHAGMYTLKVTTTFGDASAVATSAECVVTVTEVPESTDPKIIINSGTITKVNGIAVPEGETITEGNYAFNTVLTIKADENSGSFAYWKNNEARISYSKEYQFYVKGNMNIEAVFDEAVTPEPAVAFVEPTRTRDDATGKQTVKLGISVDAPPEGCTVISEGILRSYEEFTKEQAKEGTVKLTKHVSKKVFQHGNYTYSFTIASRSTYINSPIYACGYVEYADDAGERHIIYTDVEQVKVPTLGE